MLIRGLEIFQKLATASLRSRSSVETAEPYTKQVLIDASGATLFDGKRQKAETVTTPDSTLNLFACASPIATSVVPARFVCLAPICATT
jgi:hypothetical protein